MPVKPLVFIIPELAPYRLHTLGLFRRHLAGPMHLALTCAAGGFAWRQDIPGGFEVHDFSRGAAVNRIGHLAQRGAEWAKGRAICARLDRLRPAAVVVCGYADAAHRLVIGHCRSRGVAALLWADSNILSEHSRSSPLRAAVKMLLLPRLVRKCAAVLPWGTLGKQYFLKYGVPEAKIFIVSPEPDYRSIEHTPPPVIAAAGGALGLDEGRKRILYVGRLAAEKRVDLLISAFATLAPQRPNWDLLIVGDGPLRPALQKRVPEAWRRRVIFAGAKTTAVELAPLYHLGHLFVLPSDHEPWGMVVNEAAAAGLPLLLSDIVGAGADLLRDGENGRTFRHNDLEHLTQTLAELTASPKLADMGERSREILAQWRTMHPPVAGLRRALGICGVTFIHATDG